MTIIDEIVAERARQISAEGWTSEHDDLHQRGELARAAAAYAYYAAIPHPVRECDRYAFPSKAQPAASEVTVVRHAWPWSWGWWKPKDRRRDLIRAAALIVAEVERLDRAAAAGVVL